MDFIVSVIVIGVLFFIIRAIARALSNNQSKTENDSRVNNRSNEGFELATIRVVERTDTMESGELVSLYSVQTMDYAPTNVPVPALSLVVSIIDTTTENEPMPVLCLLDTLQESTTRAFQDVYSDTNVPANAGWPDWREIGIVPRDTLIPPRSGRRELTFLTRWVPTEMVSQISHGFLSNTEGMFWFAAVVKQYQFAGRGYVESQEDSERSQVLAVQLAIDISMIDGELHKEEGDIVKNWVNKYIGDYEGDEAQRIKDQMNTAMKKAYADLSAGTYDRESIVDELARIGGKLDHYEAMELLVEVMAADEVAHQDELAAISHIGNKLGVDPSELQRLKDIHVVNQENMDLDSTNLEQIIGIDSTWDKGTICNHLSNEFIKWNSRIQSLKEEDQVNGQRMLDLIAQARTKYC